MSGQIESFPLPGSPWRDLGDPDVWSRSLARSVQRRELSALSRKHAKRRKGATLAVSATMAFTPAVQPLAAAAAGSRSAAAAATAPVSRTAIHLPSGALLSEGDLGAAVAAVQRELGIDDDGIFGPITRAHVEWFQQRYGLPITGEVDARTWAALFRSNVSFVGGGGTRVMTVYRPGAASASPAADSGPATPATGSATGSGSGAVAGATAGSGPAPRHTAATAPAPAAPTPAPAVTSPAAAAPGSATAPAVHAVGGCGSGAIQTPVHGTVTGTFGESRPGHLHAGEDLAAPEGTPVRAAQCGTVTQAGTESGYGNIVCIQHAGGVSTCYAHLSQIDATQGTYVHVGDVIGRVGCTGNCTGPHLHFEVRVHGTAVNPEPYLHGTSTIPADSTTVLASASTVKATAAKATAKPATTSAPSTATAASATATVPAASTTTTTTAAGATTTTPAEAAPGASTTTTTPAAGATTTTPAASTTITTPAASTTATTPAASATATAPAEAAPAASTTTAAPAEATPAASTTTAAPAEAAPTASTTTAAPAEATPAASATTAAPAEATPAAPAEAAPAASSPAETAPAPATPAATTPAASASTSSTAEEAAPAA